VVLITTTPKLYWAEHRAYTENTGIVVCTFFIIILCNKKIDNISHHALFFDVDFYQHAKDIFMMNHNGQRTFDANFLR
jgi:phytoene desaturase